LDLFDFPLEKLKAEFDFVFVRPLGVEGEGRLRLGDVGAGLTVRGAVDNWSMMDPVGVPSVDDEVVSVS
jgi:hypothetical protein